MEGFSRRDAIKGGAVGVASVIGAALAPSAKADPAKAAADAEHAKRLDDVFGGNVIQRHTLAINKTVQRGTPCEIELDMSVRADFDEHGVKRFRPQRLTTNCCSPGEFIAESLTVDGVEICHLGMIDAWQWNPNAVGEHLDVHALTPDSKICLKGKYTGLIPGGVGFKAGEDFMFMLSFTGPIELDGNADENDQRRAFIMEKT